MTSDLLRYQYVAPEAKLIAITEAAGRILQQNSYLDDELYIMRLAIELQHEYRAAAEAAKVNGFPEPEPDPKPDPQPLPARDQMAERLAATLEDNQRLRQHKRDAADQLVAKSREISGLRSQVMEREREIANLREALKNPLHPAHDKYRELDQMMRTAPTVRG